MNEHINEPNATNAMPTTTRNAWLAYGSGRNGNVAANPTFGCGRAPGLPAKRSEYVTAPLAKHKLPACDRTCDLCCPKRVRVLCLQGVM